MAAFLALAGRRWVVFVGEVPDATAPPGHGRFASKNGLSYSEDGYVDSPGCDFPLTLWVAALLASDIGSLWGQVGAELFSGVMGVYFDPDIHEPVKTELLTPLYRLDQA